MTSQSSPHKRGSLCISPGNSNATSPTSLYRSLDETACEIRIVTLLAGRSEEPLECTLQTVPLNDPGSYEALSYTWGDASQKCRITTDHHEQWITASLDCALRHLRSPVASRRLWIDSVCINQTDKVERRHQVQLMRQIYQGASLVLAWLGPEGKGSDSGMNLIQKLARSAEDATILPIGRLSFSQVVAAVAV